MSMSLLSTAIGARPVQQKIRLPFPRSKNGCLTCRKDRKKCDEQKSVCSRCRTYGRDCAWPLPKEMLTPSPTAWRRDPPSESEVQENEQEQEPQPLQTSPAPTIIQYLSSGELSPEEDEFISDIVGTEYGLAQIRQPIFSGALQDRDPVSSLLWHHFVSDVVDNLSTRTSTRNPVRKYILPMIETDEVLLDLMVALGGINLCSKLGTPNISVVTWTCYGKVIRTLRSKTCNSHLQSPDSTLRLLTALQLLICFEIMSGNQQGAIFFHMKASRSFVLKLLDMNIDQLSEHQLAVRAFVLEMYAFFTFTAHVPPYRQTEIPKYQLRYDPFLWKLEAYGHSDVSGSAFCGTYFLISLIPRISSLSHDWNQEFTPSQRPTMEEFQILEHQIKYQQPPSEVRIRESDDLQSSIITEICRCAVLIYLYDAMRKWGDESQQDFLITIQQYSIRGLALLSKIRPSSSINMLGWPAAIIGSGLVDKGHRATMKKILAFPVFQLARRLPEMLELAWTDPNQDFGGPYSLYITMASQNHFPCIW